MKTEKSLFTLILALAVTFSFFSCGEKAETPDASSLVGTVWFASGTYSEPGYGTTTWSATVSFLTSSTGTYMIRDGDDPDPGTFTYTYTPPKVILTDDDLIFSDTCRYNPLLINLANPITGATNPALNTQTTYTIPAIITIGYNANAPYGTSFNGWTVSPNSGYTISGGTGGRNLTIKFAAYRTYTLSANFTLPGNVPYVVSKSVVVSPPPLSIPHITSDKIRVQQGAYVTFSVTNHPVSNGLVTYQWEVDGVIGSSDGSSISVSATARPSLYALQPSEGEWTMAVRCRSSGDGTNFTNWCAPVSVIVSP